MFHTTFSLAVCSSICPEDSKAGFYTTSPNTVQRAKDQPQSTRKYQANLASRQDEIEVGWLLHPTCVEILEWISCPVSPHRIYATLTSCNWNFVFTFQPKDGKTVFSHSSWTPI